MKFEYKSTHIPSGTIIKSVGEFISENAFLRLLNSWNVSGRGNYIYTAINMLPNNVAVLRFGKDNETVIQEPIRDMDDVVKNGGFWFPYVA